MCSTVCVVDIKMYDFPFHVRNSYLIDEQKYNCTLLLKFDLTAIVKTHPGVASVV